MRFSTRRRAVVVGLVLFAVAAAGAAAYTIPNLYGGKGLNLLLESRRDQPALHQYCDPGH